MADDLEAFLRQAAQRRAQRQTTAPRPAAPARPSASASPPPRVPLTPTPAPQASSSKVVTAQVVSTAEPSRLGTRVNTAEFEHRAEHLGEDVGLADEHMEAQIAQKFDHQVGSFGLGDASQTDASGGELALDVADLVAWLRNPQMLRHAVLLSEILDPPHFRR
jgi:hypothetical protein